MEFELFTVISIDDSNCIVFINNYERPDAVLVDLQDQLRTLDFNGEVYFDLLLPNGPSQRFFSMNFDGYVFELNTMKALEFVPDDVFGVSSKYFKENKHLLGRGVLLKYQIEEFMNA